MSLSRHSAFLLESQEPRKLDNVDGLGVRARSCVADLSISWKYVLADLNRSKRTFLAGVCTVFVTVFFLTFVFNIIELSPVVFLKFGENEVGAYDLVLSPGGVGTVNVGLGGITGQGDENPGDEDEEDSRSLRRGYRNNHLRQTELNATDVDTTDYSGDVLINCTDVQMKLADVDSVLGAAPRWTTLARVVNKELDDFNTSASMAMLVVMDTELEKELGIGRSWTSRVLGEGEVHISSSLARQLDIQPNLGERVIVKLSGFDIIASLLPDEDAAAEILFPAFRAGVDALNGTVELTPDVIMDQLGLPPAPEGTFPEMLEVPVDGTQIPDAVVEALARSFVVSVYSGAFGDFTEAFAWEAAVVDAVEKPDGKWPSALGNVVVMEAKQVPKLNSLIPQNPFLAKLILDQLGIDQSQWKEWTHFPIEQYAQTVLVQWADRYEAYRLTGQDLKSRVIQFTNEVSVALGFDYPVDISIALYTSLSAIQYIRYFLDQVFYGTLVVMVGLAVMLVYSLMLSDVEEKTYEFGMLRAVGFKQQSLIMLLSIQSMFYALPGLLLGLLAAYLLSIPFQIYLAEATQTPEWLGLYTWPLVLGVCIGLFVPLFANIVPIRRALSRSLREALDLYHVAASDVSVQFVRMEFLGLSLWQTYVSLTMVIAGFTVYYLIPLTFAYLQIGWFLTILTAILISMVIGLAMLATIFQPILEHCFVWMMLWGDDVRLGELVIKSLGAHRPRNRKTGLMFILSLAFIIFLGVNMTLQTTSVQDNVSVYLGGDVLLVSFQYYKHPLDEEGIREFLDREMARGDDSAVKAYTMVPNRLGSAARDSGVGGHGELYDTMGRVQRPFIHVYGAEKNYLAATFGKFSFPSQLRDGIDYTTDTTSGAKDVVRSMYDCMLCTVLPRDAVLEDDIASGSLVLPSTMNSSYEGVDVCTGRGDRHNYYYRTRNETYTNYIEPLVSAATKDFLQTNMDMPTTLTLRRRRSVESVQESLYIVKPRAYMTKMPGYFFSGYRDSTWGSPMVVSMDTFQTLYTDHYYAKYQRQMALQRAEAEEFYSENPIVPPFVYRKMMLMLRHSDPAERVRITNGLRNFLLDDLSRIFDSTEILEGTEQTTELILGFLTITAIVQSLLCFFLLWFSFVANVKENSWEFGVLRAVGLSTAQVIRVYIYEALALILACIVLGSSIGIVVALSLTLQSNLFTEMPFHFQFPWTLFLTVTSLCVIVSLSAAYLATRELRGKQIAIALRGQ